MPNVIPIFMADDKTDTNNFRPISYFQILIKFLKD